MQTFLWHDYETFGVDPRRDRPAQFAGVRTDLELNEIDEPLTLYCRLADDYLPHPAACVLTGITPRLSDRLGLVESDFALAIFDAMSVPGTINVGYNSLRFDDEVSRHLFWRNLLDPYAREYANGNTRWDLIDVLRMCFALRPEGMEWPSRADGAPSFKLEHLCRANGIEQPGAHDALVDVRALLDLARKLKRAQPKLWQHALKLRYKEFARSLLDELAMTPVVHASTRFPARFGGVSVIAPIAVHPQQPNAIICADLRHNPAALAHLSSSEIVELLYTSNVDRPDDAPRVALKLVRTNHAPMLAPLNVLNGVDLRRIELDLDACVRHLKALKEIPDLPARLRAAFEVSTAFVSDDVDSALYSGFMSNQARLEMQQIRALPPSAISDFRLNSADKRLPELLWRYRARNFPATLSLDEQIRWQQESHARMHMAALNPSQFETLIAQIRHTTEPGAPALATLDQLQAWALERHPDLFTTT